MGRLEFGRLTDGWHGEATDFTPLLASQLDALGAAISLDLTSVGEVEVPTAGGRRIDIVAKSADGPEFVVENQYGRADHDHLTRGLAYAVARRARGLIVVAEQHRDEFRAVADYLNGLAEHDPEQGIAIWLVEAKAVRIDQSRWAPLFLTVSEPNQFTALIEEQMQAQRFSTPGAFLTACTSQDVRTAAGVVLAAWTGDGQRLRLEHDHVVLEARGPAKSGWRTVIVLFTDGRVFVPFSSYAGTNSGIPIPALVGAEFRAAADTLFGFSGTEKHGRTQTGWLTPQRAGQTLTFAEQVASAYADHLNVLKGAEVVAGSKSGTDPGMTEAGTG
jgi:hypothetical protein